MYSALHSVEAICSKSPNLSPIFYYRFDNILVTCYRHIFQESLSVLIGGFSPASILWQHLDDFVPFSA